MPRLKYAVQSAPIVPIFGVGIGLWAVYLLFQKIGLIKSKEDKENEQGAATLDQGAAANPSVLNPKNPALAFNPKYWLAIVKRWQKDNKVPNITQSQAERIFNPNPGKPGYYSNLFALAKQIGSAKSTWWLPDNEENAYGALRSLRNQAQVSRLAQIFQDEFKTDLLGFIQGFTNAEQQAKIFSIIKSKPLI